VVGKVRTVASKLRNVVRYEVESRLKRRAEFARILALRAAVAGGEKDLANLEGPSFRAVYKQAEREFEAKGRLLDAPVLLVRAGGDGLVYADDVPLKGIYRDPLFGWSARVSGGAGAIEVVDAPGGHGGILREPHVATIVPPLRAAIKRATVAEVVR
jgi:thioesterase domain-containing protein